MAVEDPVLPGWARHAGRDQPGKKLQWVPHLGVPYSSCPPSVASAEAGVRGGARVGPGHGDSHSHQQLRLSLEAPPGLSHEKLGPALRSVGFSQWSM